MATTVRKTIRNGLLAISVCAAAALALPAAGASAQDDRPPDPGVRCAAKIAPGEYEFYMPGAKVTDVNGNKWVCGPDGQWFRDYSAIRAGVIDRIGGGTLGSFTSSPGTVTPRFNTAPATSLQTAR